VVYLGVGSLLWPILAVSVLITFYRLLVGRLALNEKKLSIITLLSLTPIVFGPLDWYYVYALPFLYLNFAYLLWRIKKNKLLIMATVIGIQILHCFLSLFGILHPAKIFLTI